MEPYRGHRHHDHLPPICFIGDSIPTRIMNRALYEVIGGQPPAKTHEEQQDRAKRVVERARELMGASS